MQCAYLNVEGFVPLLTVKSHLDSPSFPNSL
jgi:hypothetical protein